MNTFNLNDLRNDVDNHIREIMCGTFYYFESQDDLNDLIDHLIKALIGVVEYRLLNTYPLCRVRFVSPDQDTSLLLTLS